MGIGVVGVEGTGREDIEPGPGAGRGTEAVAAAAGLVGQGRCSNPRIGQGVRTHNQGTAGGTAGSLPEQLQVGELTAELEPECGTEGVEAWWGPGLQQRWLLGSSVDLLSQCS